MALGSKKNQSAASKKTVETIRRLEGLRKDATKPVSFRLEPRELDRLTQYAKKQGIKISQLLKSWVLDRLLKEGLR